MNHAADGLMKRSSCHVILEEMGKKIRSSLRRNTNSETRRNRHSSSSDCHKDLCVIIGPL